MSLDISSEPAELRSAWRIRAILLGLTLMLAGRAMTLAFIARAGGAELGDPPIGWLMPLVGDAVIGVTALAVAYLVWRGASLGAWLAIVVWNVVAIWDALSAFVVHLTVPWPTFFMIEIFGASMFFAASAMHVVGLVLAFRPAVRRSFFELRPPAMRAVRPA